MTLFYIIVAALAGGVLSTLAAAASLGLQSTWIPRFVSFAVGALLGAVFLDLLPGALETGHPPLIMLMVLIGLLAFFVLEKLVLWRHAHGHDEHIDERDETEHDHALHGNAAPHPDRGRPGLMILIGNSVHSFCDGIVISAAFLTDTALGMATTLAIVAHAVPQQVGDFAVLLHSGFRRRKAFVYNVTAGFATLAGALAAWFALADMQQVLPIVLALAAASLLYVAVADLIPSLHRRAQPIDTLKQMVWIALGIAIIAATHTLLEP
ncbi:MAG: ZIP family metal transporter [Casimicrobiaceae bacterium]